jgi:translation elongation factor EF-1beta
MAELETNVRAIKQDGLVWGSSKLVAIGYGIKKLQITLVIGWCNGSPTRYLLIFLAEDEKVSLDELQEKISEDEDHVQSTDVAAMQSMQLQFCSFEQSFDRDIRTLDILHWVELTHCLDRRHIHVIVQTKGSIVITSLHLQGVKVHFLLSAWGEYQDILGTVISFIHKLLDSTYCLTAQKSVLHSDS